MAEQRGIISTDGYAYPLDSANMPQLAVYNAPYSEGDCPLWVLLLQKKSAFNRWSASADGRNYSHIEERAVTVIDWDEDVFEHGKDYEIHIYDSGIPVSE